MSKWMLAGLGLVLSAGMGHAQTAPRTTSQATPADRPAAAPIKASKIILVGDSTTQVLSGWGGSFCAYHVTSFAACVNLARGGRSTYSYRAEGSWDLALAEMKTPGFVKTYVLIQFGHNDQPGKPGRSTDLATEFPANLRRYVAEARSAGAEPILLTPLTRRQFKDGKLDRDLEPWSASIRKVAAELNVPLVDLNKRSADAVEALGPSMANRFAQVPPVREVSAAALTGTTIANPTAAAASPAAPQNNAAVEPLGDAKLAFDYTHLGPVGADFFSKMVADELAVAVPKMRPLLVP
ncbi:lysophospholipase L1-like esterase [Sphingomonas kyeonggiensis]|uniref:Lysophospholipase L1-like esterase n=1 Tax=Sphingomonas kyeonggiensis TaxID=1268553 RepID=A0A7W7NS88_9SPHN|nr:rhamnogalacturonan acetylesterase [Sphingomonas kyeonggiensis]MBB4838399.1 lysophospholipase L1-like esterase [Sphingomonas kyeonggiensis]